MNNGIANRTCSGCGVSLPEDGFSGPNPWLHCDVCGKDACPDCVRKPKKGFPTKHWNGCDECGQWFCPDCAGDPQEWRICAVCEHIFCPTCVDESDEWMHCDPCDIDTCPDCSDEGCPYCKEHEDENVRDAEIPTSTARTREEKFLKFKSTPSGARPSFFQALCLEARAGGSHSYWTAGHELYRHHEGEVDDVAAKELIPLVKRKDAKSIIAWFRHYLPRCMKMVPSKRRQTFARGVLEFEAD